MKITKITIDSLAVPLIHPYHLSKEYGVFSTATPIIVTMETDEGITGYGECDPWPLFTGDSVYSAGLVIEQHLAPMLIGKDPTNINALHRIMDATVDTINAMGGITAHHAVEGFGKLEFATTDMRKVMDGADIVMIVLPSLYHKSITEQMIPYLKDGMVVILHPESSAGAISFRKVMQNMNCTADIVVGAASTLLYSTRVNEPGDVYVFGLKSDVPMAALPARDNDKLASAIRPVLPQFRIVKNTLYTSLGNLNAMMHPAPMLLCTSRIEAEPFVPFAYYHEGITPSIGKYVEAMDAERILVAKALGFELRGVREDYVAMYKCGDKDTSLYHLVRNNEGYDGIMCSNTLSTRYVLEDIPYSLEPIRAIARAAGVVTPCIDAIITVARTILGEQMHEGRTAEALGIDKMNKEELLAYIEG